MSNKKRPRSLWAFFTNILKQKEWCNETPFSLYYKYRPRMPMCQPISSKIVLEKICV